MAPRWLSFSGIVKFKAFPLHQRPHLSDDVLRLTGSIPSAEMGSAHRPSALSINLTSCPKRADHGRNPGGKVMTTVSRGLPERPHLDVPKREARELLDQCKKRDKDALERIRRRHPKFKDVTDDAAIAIGLKLGDAQLVVAREYGLSNWTMLKQRIEANSAANALHAAIRGDDREAVVAILRANPEMLHLPLWSGNWGPPMSHAANLGRLDIIKAVAALGARDHQHAFDRALLQGKLECARWLHEQGARLTPGIVMGACETLNPAGLGFLAEVGAPFTDAKGDRFAPLALVLETYGRNPAGKH